MTVLVTQDGRLLNRATPLRGGARLRASWLTGDIDPFREVSTWNNHEPIAMLESRSLSYGEAYERIPTVAAVVNKLVRQIATLPLKVYEVDGAGDHRRVRDHPLARLLGKPAPRRGAHDLKQWIATPALVWGNALVGKWRGDGPDAAPTELLPVRWEYVSAYAAENGPIEFWETVQTGERRVIAVEDTVHFAWHSPNGGEIGVSPLRQLAEAIRLDDAAMRFQTAAFRNGARPSGAVVLPMEAQLLPDERAELRDELRVMHEGVDNAFRVALLSGGAKLEPMCFSANEAELIAQRTLNREEVARVYDVPLPLIGDLTHGTYSNVEELHRMLYVTVLRPWLAMIEETLQAQLIDPEPAWQGLRVEFDLAEVLRGDKSEEIAAAVAAFTNGLMTLNECRKVLNLPRIDDRAADVPHIPTNNLSPIDGEGDPESAPGASTPPTLS